MYRYKIFQMEPPFSPQNQYGLLAQKELAGTWSTIAAAYPFSSSMAAVSRLAEQCTSLQLSPLHLLDVVQDFAVSCPLP